MTTCDNDKSIHIYIYIYFYMSINDLNLEDLFVFICVCLSLFVIDLAGPISAHSRSRCGQKVQELQQLLAEASSHNYDIIQIRTEENVCGLLP